MVSFKRRVLLVVGAGLTVVAVSGAMVGSASAKSGGGALRVEIVDDCNPATFNAVLGPGACVGRGETTFQQFIAELTAERSVDDWAFDPDSESIAKGQPVSATNRGGEAHTFTCVKKFGGGIVPLLNQLSHNTTLATLCSGESFTGAPNATFGATLVLPGATKAANLSVPSAPGVYKFECLIHPWMRSVLRVERN